MRLPRESLHGSRNFSTPLDLEFIRLLSIRSGFVDDSPTMAPALTYKSPEFYFEDPLVIVRIKAKLYRVFRDDLKRESAILKTVLEEDASVGRVDGNPVVLPFDSKCTCDEFEAFLSYLYNRDLSSRDIFFFSALLRVSQNLACANAFNCALEGVESRASSADPIFLLNLAKTQHLDNLKSQAFMSLARRALCLTDDEAELLDKEDLLMLFRIRNQLFIQEGNFVAFSETQHVEWPSPGAMIERLVFFDSQKAERAAANIAPSSPYATIGMASESDISVVDNFIPVAEGALDSPPGTVTSLANGDASEPPAYKNCLLLTDTAQHPSCSSQRSTASNTGITKKSIKIRPVVDLAQVVRK